MARPDWNNDPYTQRAKREGYLARSAYKLLEIQEKRTVLRSGDRVLDLGCAPGAWIQVASRIVGANGAIVGVDLQHVRPQFGPNVRLIEGDVCALDPAEVLDAEPLAGRAFDVVLSDMAPSTGGGGGGSADHFASMRLCERALAVALATLRPGGSLVMKALEGETYPDLLAHASQEFESARGLKPKASRSASREMFVICMGRRSGPGKSEPT